MHGYFKKVKSCFTSKVDKMEQKKTIYMGLGHISPKIWLFVVGIWVETFVRALHMRITRNGALSSMGTFVSAFVLRQGY